MSVELETGEKFSGDPLEVTTKLAEAQVNTKRWGQGFKQELETLKSAPPIKVPDAATPDPQEAQLQAYLLNQTAKGLGYENADQFKADLSKVKATSEKVANNIIITDFMNLAPDFPNTNEASDALAKKIDAMGWDFSPQSMFAAHSVLVREHAQDPTKGYAPLTAEQINSQWADDMQRSSRQAPPMIRSSSPDSHQQGDDPYGMKLEDLRKAAIAQELSK